MAEINIHGTKFQVTEDPSLAVGTPMTEGHIKALQAARVAALRNRFTQNLKGKEFNPDAVQEELNKSAEAYTFGASMRGKSGGRRVTDPVEREALNLARQAIAMAYEVRHGVKADPAAVRENADAWMATPRGEDFRKKARVVLRDRAAAGSDILDNLNLSAPPQAQAA